MSVGIVQYISPYPGICYQGNKKEGNKISTWMPFVAKSCLKSASRKSPTKTDLCGGGVSEGRSGSIPSDSWLPISPSTHATS